MFNIKTPVLHQAKIKFACKTFAASIILTLGWLYLKKNNLVGILNNQIIKKTNFKMEKNEIWDFSSAVKSACPSVNPRPKQFKTHHRITEHNQILQEVHFAKKCWLFYSWSPSFCLWHVIQFHHKST